jgi:hypothetical protein
MYELIEARTRLYPKLARLHGKLSLIASQVNKQKKTAFYLSLIENKKILLNTPFIDKEKMI